MDSASTVAASRLLAWWRMGIIDPAQVTAWADGILASSSNVPVWVADLAMQGPERYLSSRSDGDPKVAELDFRETFAAYVEITDLESSASIERFMNWLVSAAIGGNLEDPLVLEAYQIDHLESEVGDRDAAMQRTKALLAEYKSVCHPIAEALIA